MQLLISEFDGEGYTEIGVFGLANVRAVIISDVFELVVEPHLDRLVLREVRGQPLIIQPHVSNSVAIGVDSDNS